LARSGAPLNLGETNKSGPGPDNLGQSKSSSASGPNNGSKPAGLSDDEFAALVARNEILQGVTAPGGGILTPSELRYLDTLKKPLSPDQIAWSRQQADNTLASWHESWIEWGRGEFADEAILERAEQIKRRRANK
jgi:hypothetical protein